MKQNKMNEKVYKVRNDENKNKKKIKTEDEVPDGDPNAK